MNPRLLPLLALSTFACTGETDPEKAARLLTYELAPTS